MTAGLELFTEVHGAGLPAIVQPPAWGPSSDYLRRTLVPLLDGLRTVTYDARNTGRSPRTGEEEVELETLVRDLDDVRRLHRLERFLLIGHSHGGWIAMAYAVRYPERLLGLALLDTSLREPELDAEAEAILRQYEDDPRRRQALRWYRRHPRRPVGIDSDRQLGLWIRRTMPVRFHDLDAMRQFQRRLVGSPLPSVAALRSAPRIGADEGVEAALPRVQVPAVVVAGRHDPATPPVHARRIQRLLPRARLVVFERSGHNPWAEEPRKFARAMGRLERTIRFGGGAAEG